jgi:hypothetical protein
MPGDSQPVSGKRTQETLPDGTVNTIYFVDVSGQPRWSRGLPALLETSSGGVWQSKVKTTWTQDNTSVDYPLNPRVVDTNVHDPAGNRARTAISYEQFAFTNGTSCSLPRDVSEYDANASDVLRTTRTNYNMHATYTDRRILGLPSEKLLYDGTVAGTLMSKIEFIYDEGITMEGTEQPLQHDGSNYPVGLVGGRANVTKVKRYNVDNPTEFTATTSKYNRAGSLVSSKDAFNHEVTFSYADSFSDNLSRNTFAYPTTTTDPDNFSSTAKYNFDFGAVTYKQTPKPNVTNQDAGPEQTFTFDSIGRPQQVTNLVNSAYTRFVYVGVQLKVETYTTIQNG